MDEQGRYWMNIGKCMLYWNKWNKAVSEHNWRWITSIHESSVFWTSLDPIHPTSSEYLFSRCLEPIKAEPQEMFRGSLGPFFHCGSCFRWDMVGHACVQGILKVLRICVQWPKPRIQERFLGGISWDDLTSFFSMFFSSSSGKITKPPNTLECTEYVSSFGFN